ncbi:hypothetical protein Glove_476g2 [Diversispora epigaea]|uniref:Protein kinase domain-containing protein n=1 Tax=Diversispora epigaea TaxID=1348612 RepID=A0A397GM87_9GLOM|nr:hypothetical protein Glove_476g2 [Diversispora epigaea]
MIRRIIQGSQINKIHNLQWIPYDNFKEIKHIADGGHGSNGMKVVLKEIKDSRFNIDEFLKVVKTVNDDLDFIDTGEMSS